MLYSGSIHGHVFHLQWNQRWKKEQKTGSMRPNMCYIPSCKSYDPVLTNPKQDIYKPEYNFILGLRNAHVQYRNRKRNDYSVRILLTIRLN